MKFTTTLLATAAITGALSCAVALPAAAQEITGAGATFPAPVYTKWGEAAKAAVGVTLNYQAIGSGGGQNQIINRTVDFGASDAPVDAEKLATNKLVQFPMVMGAVVPIVNLPGIEADQLKLTGEILADIYAGKITKWNDAKIEAINAGLKLPSIAIAPVYRADASGTSFVFTSYLSSASESWKSAVGASTSVKWPVGNGAKGNDGVAGSVKQVRGGIGYVENAYASQNKLSTTELKNKDGHFVKPTMAAFQAAAAGADWKGAKNYAVSLIDQPGATSWPIVSATFLLLPTDPKDPARAQTVLKWANWDYENGDAIASQLEYVPLPAAVKALVRETWKQQLNYK